MSFNEIINRRPRAPASSLPRIVETVKDGINNALIEMEAAVWWAGAIIQNGDGSVIGDGEVSEDKV